jgi:hypothetical protein
LGSGRLLRWLARSGAQQGFRRVLLDFLHVSEALVFVDVGCCAQLLRGVGHEHWWGFLASAWSAWSFDLRRLLEEVAALTDLQVYHIRAIFLAVLALRPI